MRHSVYVSSTQHSNHTTGYCSNHTLTAYLRYAHTLLCSTLVSYAPAVRNTCTMPTYQGWAANSACTAIMGGTPCNQLLEPPGLT